MKNRIAMAGRIERCWLFVYRVPIAQLSPLLPPPLELVTKGGFGFLNIVVSDLKRMRPAFSPLGFGLAYRHVAYRLHVEYHGHGGLFFLRSDADSPLVCATGNMFTDFKFHRARVEISDNKIQVHATGANADIQFTADQPQLTQDSPFQTLEEAACFLKYKPAALAVRNGVVLRLPIQRDESAWQSDLITPARATFEFLNGLDATFELCYSMRPIDYIWKAEEVVQ